MFHIAVSRLSLLLVVIFALSIFIVPPTKIVNSGTIVDHDVVGNVTWSKSGSPYIVREYISVIGSLTIEPGVAVIIESGGIAVSGKLIAMGSQGEPVVLNASEAFNIDVKSGSEIYIANTIIEKTLNISSDNSAVNIVNISGSRVVISKSISSKILIDGATLDAILLNQTVPRKYMFFSDSEITVRNAYLIYGFSSNAYIERCRLFIDNVTVLLRIDASHIANRSNIVINNVITTSIFVIEAYDTDVAITNSIIMNGEGIYVLRFMNIVRDRVTFTANYNTFYNLNSLTGKNAITVLFTSRGVFFDLRYNFWGDTSYDINPSNVTIIVDPRLPQPATSLLREMIVMIDPPIPAVSGQLSIDMQPKYPDMVYTLLIYYPERGWVSTYIENRNGTFTVTTSENMVLYAVAYSKPMKYIFSKRIDIKPEKVMAWVYSFSISPPELFERFITSNSIKITAYVDARPTDVLKYLDIMLVLDGSFYDNRSIIKKSWVYRIGRASLGIYEIMLNLQDGSYWATLYPRYAGLNYTQRTFAFAVDTNPPMINASYRFIDRTRVAIDVHVVDYPALPKRVSLYIDGRDVYRDMAEGSPEFRKTYELEMPGGGVVVIEAEDMAGHVSRVSFVIWPSAMQITTKPGEARTLYTETIYRVSTVTIASTKTVPVIVTQPQPTTVTLTQVKRVQGVPIELAIAIAVIAIASTAAIMRIFRRS